MERIPREQVLKRLRNQIAQGRTLIGAGVGNGVSAKYAEKGGADFVIIYNSGRFGMNENGPLAGLMPYGDANAIIIDMAKEILTIVKDTPVFAGVCGTDPYRDMEVFLKQLIQLGFSGVQNFPTVGICDGAFRDKLEESGMSYDLEVEMVRNAHELDLVTIPHVFNVGEAIKMTEAGADVLVTHMGLVTKGTIGLYASKTLKQCAADIQAIYDQAVKINPDILVMCHGGPIIEPKDVKYILESTKNIAGFFQVSDIERLPAQIAAIKKL